MSGIDSKIAKKIVKASKNNGGELGHEQVLSILRDFGVGADAFTSLPTVNPLTGPNIPRNYKTPPKTMENWNRIPIGLRRGKTEDDEPILVNWDLCKYRYLLVTGRPGTGKSVVMKNIYDWLITTPQLADTYYMSTLSQTFPSNGVILRSLVESLEKKLVKDRESGRKTVLIVTVSNMSGPIKEAFNEFIARLFKLLSYYPNFSLAIEAAHGLDTKLDVEFKDVNCHYICFNGSTIKKDSVVSHDGLATGTGVSHLEMPNGSKRVSVNSFFKSNGSTDDLIRYSNKIDDFAVALVTSPKDEGKTVEELSSEVDDLKKLLTNALGSNG